MSGDKQHVALSNTRGSGDLGSFGGTVHAGIARWLDIMPGHHNLQHLQKTKLLGSTRILVKSCLLSRQP